MKLYTRSLVLFFFQLCLSYPLQGYAAFDPSIKWSVLETDHFEVLFDKKYEKVGRLYAVQAERAYQMLQPIFRQMPDDKTVIVIDDSTDYANGFATFIPYPYITIHPVLPDSLSSLTYYDQWSLDIILHEYAHILSFLPVNGMYTPFKYIFGSILRPNAVLPRWYLEGLAVEVETRLTKHGRLRSPAYSANLRALVSEGRLLNEGISRVNESSIPTWPFGQRPYFLGGLLWSEMVRQSEPGIVHRLNQRYGRRLPFFLDAPIEDELGKSYDQLLDQLYKDLEFRGKHQLQAIRRAGQAPEKIFPSSGVSQHSPAVSPDGQHMVYLSYLAEVGAELRLASRPADSKQSFSDLKSKKMRFVRGTLGVSWVPTSKALVFDQLDTFDRYYKYRDLYLLDIDSNGITRLTHGQRAQEPAVSPDGTQVAFVKLTGVGSELALLNLKSLEVRSVFTPKFQHRISRPDWINEQEVVFTHRDTNGQERLSAIDIDSGRIRPLATGHKAVSQPKVTKKGLLFASADTGVSNLYMYTSKKSYPVTNSVTQVQNGDYDPVANEIIFSQLTADGHKLFAKNLKVERPPQVESMVDRDWPNVKAVTGQYQIMERDYSSLKYLIPRYWVPFVYPAESAFLVQATTLNYDPLERHSYLLNLSYDSITEELGYGVSYINKTTPVDIGALYAQYFEYLFGADVTITHRMAALSGDFFLPGASERWRSGLDWSYRETAIGGQDPAKRTGPGMSLSWSNIDKPPAPHFFGGGTQWSVGFNQYLSGTEQVGYSRYSLSLVQRFIEGLPAKHNFVTKLRAAAAPELELSNIAQFGEKTVGGRFVASLISSSFLLRGYPSGDFIGRSMINSNFEYSFPLMDIYQGKSTLPFFLQRIEAALFADAVALDGRYLNAEATSYVRDEFKTVFWGVGAELALKTTFAYHLPVSFIFGMYYGLNKEARSGFLPFIAIGYDGFGGID